MAPTSDDFTEGAPTHRVELVLSPLIKLPGVGAFHSSVMIDGVEIWFNPEGLCYGRVPGIMSHTSTIAEPIRLLLGDSVHSLKDLLDTLGPHFRSGTYDMIRKNCNAFSDCAVYFLLRRRMMTQYLMLDHIAALVPETASKVIGSRYKKNPRADDFDIESVIEELGPEDAQEMTTGKGSATFRTLLSGCRLSYRPRAFPSIPSTTPSVPAAWKPQSSSSSSSSTTACLDSSTYSDSVDDDCIIVSDADEEEDGEVHNVKAQGDSTGFVKLVTSPLFQCTSRQTAQARPRAQEKRDSVESERSGLSSEWSSAELEREGNDLMLAL